MPFYLETSLKQFLKPQFYYDCLLHIAVLLDRDHVRRRLERGFAERLIESAYS
jgi:hypothetical protein